MNAPAIRLDLLNPRLRTVKGGSVGIVATKNPKDPILQRSSKSAYFGHREQPFRGIVNGAKRRELVHPSACL